MGRFFSVTNRRKTGLAPLHGDGIATFTNQISDRMKGYLLIVGTGLNDDTPPVYLSCNCSFENGGKSRKLLGRFDSKPEFLEKASRDFKRQAQAIGLESYCFTVSVGGKAIGTIFFENSPSTNLLL